MMGQAVDRQDRLFYEFNLDERIPANHLLRRIDGVLDLSWLRAELSPFYSHTGCPAVDPELMIQMLLVGYCYLAAQNGIGDVGIHVGAEPDVLAPGIGGEGFGDSLDGVANRDRNLLQV